MITRRRLTATLVLAALAAPVASLSQRDKVWRIGYLAARSRSTGAKPDVYYDAFVRGMRDLGYVEGKNLTIEWRFADGNDARLPGLAAELVRAKVDVIVAHSTPGARAAQEATDSIPIVMHGIDPVSSGLVKSLARPGGNITGQSLVAVDLSLKQIELLKAMLPALSRLAVLVNLANPGQPAVARAAQAAAQQMNVKPLMVNAGSLEDIERGFAGMKAADAEALLVTADSLFVWQQARIAELAQKNGMPSMFHSRGGVQAGGLMSYGQDLEAIYRHAATYVDKILKGSKAAELPVEQPMRAHLAINHKTARVLRINVPRDLLLRADEVIE